MKIKHIKQINTYITKWLKKQGFNIKAEMGTDFAYWEQENIITYSFFVPASHDELFLEHCSSLRCNLPSQDVFLLSFFHELGHYATTDYFTDEEYENYITFVQELQVEPEQDSRDQYIKYYTCDIEQTATEWGLDYILTHQRQIKSFVNKLSKLERKFIKRNNITLDNCEINSIINHR